MKNKVTYIRHKFNAHEIDLLAKMQPTDNTKKIIAFCYWGEGFKENFDHYAEFPKREPANFLIGSHL
jgi:hypothetical protein